MSELKVPVVSISSILPHPNADRLEVAVLDGYGWEVVVQKGRFLPGNVALYLPVDCVLPEQLETYLFPPDSAIKLNKSRVRAIRIRSYVSTGMLVSPAEYAGYTGGKSLPKIGTDMANDLGITKYEPPTREQRQFAPQQKKRKLNNPWLRRYTDLQHLKWYPHLFDQDEPVVVTEKLHGCNARYGWLPMARNNWWRKLLHKLYLLPKWEFCYGSHNVQIQQGKKKKDIGYKNEQEGIDLPDVWTKMIRQYDLDRYIPHGFTVYGEIVGHGVQKNYSYGCQPGEHKFVVFDVARYNSDPIAPPDYLSHDEYMDFCTRHIPHVPRAPILYKGGYDYDRIDALREGNSEFAPSQKVREGLVIKPIVEQQSRAGRKIIKFVSDSYLLKEQSDFH